jgi:molybdenum cofactor cytidylyltransferase
MPGTIVGILLAAGRGSRFGSDKLLHPLTDGTPMAVAAARNLRPACERLIAVLRPGSEVLAGLLANENCEPVFCQDADAGMGHSLAVGVRASAEAAAWVVALADMPFILPNSHLSVAAALRAGASLAASDFNGRRGHPVGFAGQWFDQLSALTGDQGGKSILQAHPQKILLCPVADPGVIRDIDRPEDLE